MTSEAMSAESKTGKGSRQLSAEQAAAAAMVAEARERGLELTGPNGLLNLFTKNVLETALNEEMTEHLGHEKNRTEPGRESRNVRNGGLIHKALKKYRPVTALSIPEYLAIGAR